MDGANIEVSRPLNYLTARPTLELLLALSDYEAPDVAPDDALAVFADFLALPQDQGAIDAGFQTEVVAEVPTEGELTLILGLRYPNSSEPPEPPLDPSYRSVGIRWDLRVASPGRFEVIAVWAHDYPDLNTFVDTVRATAEWREGIRATRWSCTVFAEDD
jgi:hypothetical protein